MAGTANTKSAWSKRGVHKVTCPSGQVVKIRIPNVARLAREDAIPERLVAAALREVMTGTPLEVVTEPDGTKTPRVDVDAMKEVDELYSFLLVQSLVDPAIATVEELEQLELPQEDVDMLQLIITRERDTDALGVRLGVAPLKPWEPFLQEHECPPDCEACAKAFARLSTAGVD